MVTNKPRLFLLLFLATTVTSALNSSNLRLHEDEQFDMMESLEAHHTEGENSDQKVEFNDDSERILEEEKISRRCIKVEEIPKRNLRIAMQLLHDVSGTESAPAWDGAYIGPCVRELRRPDIRQPAYYEFRVYTGRTQSGFIVVSSGEHDYPVAHWNFQGKSPTDQLLEMSRQSDMMTKKGHYYFNVFKLDTLSYVLEDGNGRMIANLGEIPKRIKGHQYTTEISGEVPDTEVIRTPSSNRKNSLTAARGSRSNNDESPPQASYDKRVSGPKEGSLTFQAWDSWEELKKSYKQEYETMIYSLRKQAAEDWEVDKLAAKDGEGLVVHETYELALLHSGSKFSVEGDGAKLVSVEQITEISGRREVLQITVHTGVPPKKEMPFKVNIYYRNGARESILFVVVSEKDVDDSRHRNLEEGSVTETHWIPQEQEQEHHRRLGPWSPWYQYQAGSHWDQRHYNQIPKGVHPNNKNCYSGCGATAWAMLFGWADYQAAIGNSYWKPRWGLYRVNGGKGADATAPKYMTNGVRNMIWEIRNYIKTWCIGNSGATFPWKMDEASQYFKGRTGTKLSTNYNVLGISTKGLREKARNSIIYRKTPAVIGTGWLQHYPLAYAYRWRKRRVKKCILFVCWYTTEYQRQFYVNQGWGGSGNGWVNANTWFVGQIYP